MELCRHCGIRPPHRTNSRTCSVCKYKRSSKAKERAANPKKRGRKPIEDMKVCKVCKKIPVPEGKAMCDNCKELRKINGKEGKPASENKNVYHRKEFWIETPHKVYRSYLPLDNFNNFY